MFIADKQMRRVRPWFAEDGDYTYRLNYDSLDKNSIVVDLGGYKGQWASDIFSKYQSRVFVFEPVAAYFNFITVGVVLQHIKPGAPVIHFHNA